MGSGAGMWAQREGYEVIARRFRGCPGQWGVPPAPPKGAAAGSRCGPGTPSLGRALGRGRCGGQRCTGSMATAPRGPPPSRAPGRRGAAGGGRQSPAGSSAAREPSGHRQAESGRRGERDPAKGWGCERMPSALLRRPGLGPWGPEAGAQTRQASAGETTLLSLQALKGPSLSPSETVPEQEGVGSMEGE